MKTELHKLEFASDDNTMYIANGVSLMNALALAAQKWPDAHPGEVHIEPHNSGEGAYLRIRWSHKIVTHI